VGLRVGPAVYREIDRAQFSIVGPVVGETPGRMKAGAHDKHREKNVGWAHGEQLLGWKFAVPVHCLSPEAAIP
jgi:hypothetical protein